MLDNEIARVSPPIIAEHTRLTDLFTGNNSVKTINEWLQRNQALAPEGVTTNFSEGRNGYAFQSLPIL